jgi:hypothetical protein
MERDSLPAGALSLRRFCREWVARAWSGRFKRAKEIQGVAALVCGFLAVLIREKWPEMSPFLSLLTWAPFLIFGAAFVAFLAYGLMTAPYTIYLNEARKVADAQAKVAAMQSAMEPLLEFVDAEEMAVAKLRGLPDAAVVHRICVRNASTATKLDEVELRLVATIEADGTRRAVGERLREAGTGAVLVTIGPGAKRYFEPFFVRPDKNPPRMYLAPHGANVSQHTRGPGNFVFEIEATGSASLPQLAKFEVDMGSNGKVRIAIRK